MNYERLEKLLLYSLMVNIFIITSMDFIFFDTVIFLTTDTLKSAFTYIVLLQAIMGGIFYFNKTFCSLKQIRFFLTWFFYSLGLLFVMILVGVLLTYQVSFDLKVIAQLGMVLYAGWGVIGPVIFFGSFSPYVFRLFFNKKPPK